ncbi:peptidase S1 [Humibacillus sp. DSM 29435]|uniref:trypsin-like peptidase domain-containing protein n=1 Tax=Humibacillus sp. DSM 29435 TaxID=1869167 RepID=UPI0008725E83|nr:trypsin-like peptidase domain-containing protein [Humibacillus sp. DSM 29435]OFE16784.1 peptidase S1 [Humibacillus sp. DSM 29435]
MSEQVTPRADEPSGPGDPEPAPRATPPAPEHTGVIDVASTQAIPSAPPLNPSTSQAAGSGGPAPAGAAHDDWFDTFAAQHPSEGPSVPTRADSAWGSDRADAVAEAAHFARYAPPQAPAAASDGASVSPMSAVASGSAPSSAAGPAMAAPSGGSAWPIPDAAPQGVPFASPPPDPTRNRRGPLVALIAAVALVAGVVGGVGGQLLSDRVQIGGSSLPEPGPGATVRPPGSVASIAAVALPSVVTIKVDAGAEGSGTGSGFVIDNRGHVLTNNHVVGAAAKGGDIEIVLSNGDTEKATIVGRDVSYDLAVLKLARTDLTPLVLGESDQVVVGDQVIAVGAPLGLEQTVTTGIVSALNRPVTPGTGDEASFINAIQTDAAINPGNSGGPLLDSSGKVIGVNSAIARVPGTTSSSGGNIGLGFAIPSDQARRTADQLIATGKATHPVIGVSLDRTYSGEGAQVVDTGNAVTANGPAAKAGVQPGDIIIGFEGKRVRTPDQLIVSIRARAVGETVTLKVTRDSKQIDLKMTLEAATDK